jgi:DNA end-binding protein Ku
MPTSFPARFRDSPNEAATSHYYPAGRGFHAPVLARQGGAVHHGWMRSIWKGSLTFGLVNVPVKVYSATEEKDIRFRQVHGEDMGRIRYQRTCEKCGMVVPFEDIEKAFEGDDGQMVLITDEDLETLPADRSREIEIVEFVPSDQIDPLMFDRPYYLEPATNSPKAYVLLRKTLQQTDRIAIAKFALRQKQRLAVLRVRDDVLVVQTLLWPDEVRAADFAGIGDDVEISEKELKMAVSLVDSFAADFEPDEFVDEYRVELQQLIDAKLEGGEAFAEEETATGEDAEVLDLLAALQRSVERQKGAKDEGGSKATAKTSAKTSAQSDDDADDKKSTASKPAAKKETETKTPSKRATRAKSDEAPARRARKPA